jgi:hypothetical protein
MMLLWKKRATALCPRCLLEVEDATHGGSARPTRTQRLDTGNRKP